MHSAKSLEHTNTGAGVRTFHHPSKASAVRCQLPKKPDRCHPRKDSSEASLASTERSQNVRTMPRPR